MSENVRTASAFFNYRRTACDTGEMSCRKAVCVFVCVCVYKRWYLCVYVCLMWGSTACIIVCIKDIYICALWVGVCLLAYCSFVCSSRFYSHEVAFLSNLLLRSPRCAEYHVDRILFIGILSLMYYIPYVTIGIFIGSTNKNSYIKRFDTNPV